MRNALNPEGGELARRKWSQRGKQAIKDSGIFAGEADSRERLIVQGGLQALVLMKLPSELVEVLEEFEFEPSMLASELWMKEEIMDCADWALVVDEVSEVEFDALAVLAAKALMRFWNTELKVEVTPLDALDPALKLPRIWLLADWFARIVNADTVAAMLVDELLLVPDASLAVAAVLAIAGVLAAVESAVELVPDAELEEFKRLDVSEAWLLTLPIDITCFCRDRWNQVVGRELENFRGAACKPKRKWFPHLPCSARAHFLKSSDKFYEIPLQARHSQFAKLCDRNWL
jgi:hypothetical protein